MSICNIKNCKSQAFYVCKCQIPGEVICKEHIQYHKVLNPQYEHSFEELLPENSLDIYKHLILLSSELSQKIQNEALEQINVIKTKTQEDLLVVNNLQIFFRDFYQKNSIESREFFKNIDKVVNEAQPHYRNHFKPYMMSILKIAESVNERIQIRQTKSISIPRYNNRKIDRQPEVVERDIPNMSATESIPSLKDEDWCISSKKGLKKLPIYVVKQILQARSKNLPATTIINPKNNLTCNYVDFVDMKYYWYEVDGSLRPNYEKLIRIKRAPNN